MHITDLRKPYVSFLAGKHVYDISFFILTFLCKPYLGPHVGFGGLMTNNWRSNFVLKVW
jgi:hypothetical protein